MVDDPHLTHITNIANRPFVKYSPFVDSCWEPFSENDSFLALTGETIIIRAAHISEHDCLGLETAIARLHSHHIMSQVPVPARFRR